LSVKSISVLAAVKLYDQESLEAHEVENVISKRVLSAKFAILDLSATEALPKQALSVGRRIPQAALQLRFENAFVGLAFHWAPIC